MSKKHPARKIRQPAQRNKPSIYKLHIHKWAKFSQANYFAVYAAQQIVLHADLTYQLIQKVRSRELDRLLPGIASDEQWLYLGHL